MRPNITVDQLAILLLGAGMITIGILGLTGNLTLQAVLFALILGTVSLVSFHLGMSQIPHHRA